MSATVLAFHLRWLLAARDVLSAALAGGLVVGLAGLVALHDLDDAALAASAVLWLVAAVAGLLASARMLAAEHQGGGLRAVLLAPIERATLFVARATAAALLVIALAVGTWTVLVLLFPNEAGLRSVALVPAVALGAIGLAIVGTLTSFAALSSRAGELLGVVLGVPIAAPLLIAVLHATEEAITTGAVWSPSLTFALGYDLAVGAAAYLVAGHVTEVP